MSDFFNAFDEEATSQPIAHNNQSSHGGHSQPRDNRGYEQQGGGSYAEEIYSKKIETSHRTYFIDLKQSQYGKFLKVSERSRGQKNTIMIDAEHLEEFIESLQEAKNNL